MEEDETCGKYKMLDQLLKDEKGHDEITAHIESTGITSEESRAILYKTEEFLPPLMLAVQYRRTDVINFLIQNGFDPHTPYKTGVSGEETCYYLIHEACAFGHISVIKYLVDELHVDVNVVDMNSETSIMFALSAETVDEETKLETVKYLVEKGEDVRETADLHFALSLELYEVSKYLISCGGMLCAKPPNYESPLMYVAQSGNFPVAKLLVEAGASIDGSKGRKLLLTAVAHDNLEIVQYCCSLNIDPDWDREFVPALHIAIEAGASEVVRYLVVEFNVSLDRTGPDGQTAFDLAFRRKDIDFVKLFMEAGYNPWKEPCLSEDHEDEHLQELAQTVQEYVAKRTLQDRCVFQVRRSLGRWPNQKVEQLGLPTMLKDMVQLDHIPESARTPFSLPTFMRMQKRVTIIRWQYDAMYENNGIDPLGWWTYRGASYLSPAVLSSSP